jgi:hypothetical protein
MHTWIAMYRIFHEISSEILSTGEGHGSERFCTATWQITPSGTAGKPTNAMIIYLICNDFVLNTIS